MTGVETITARIIEDAESRAAAIRQEGEDKAGLLLAEGRKQCDEITASWNARINTEGGERYRRILAMGELERRKMVLAAKQSSLDTLYAKVLDGLCALDDQAWTSLVSGMVLSAAEGGELLTPAESEKARWDAVLPKINVQLQELGKQPVTLSGTGSFRGGCMLTAGGVSVNLTFDAIVNTLRQDTETASAEKLFG